MTADRALEIADRLAQPAAAGLPNDRTWWRQCLAHGVPGIALLHTELAAAGLRPFRRVHDWLTVAAGSAITTGACTGLFYGAPAVASALAGVAAVRPGAYRAALKFLDARIAADVHRRVGKANARIAAGRLPVISEFDTIRGLAGVGAYLLRRDPDGAALRAVLGYLAQLTNPVTINGQPLPGWWTLTGPTGRFDPEFGGGHGNFGLAHGICGPLAVLAQSLRRGISVAGQHDAIDTICTWLDFWRIDTDAGCRWPYMIIRCELGSRPTHVRYSGAKRRPSWCYGTAGIARSLQLAALATADTNRQRIAEDALVSALTDPAQRAVTTDGSLCHGYAGLARITACAAADAAEPMATRLQALVPELLDRSVTQPATDTPGLLEGAAGIALAALAPAAGAPTPTNWDACLLIA
jgi:lantibiotic biosynthesis protein